MQRCVIWPWPCVLLLRSDDGAYLMTTPADRLHRDFLENTGALCASICLPLPRSIHQLHLTVSFVPWLPRFPIGGFQLRRIPSQLSSPTLPCFAGTTQ